jgi:hypothetical protein
VSTPALAQVLSAAAVHPVTARQFAVALGIDPGGTSGLLLGAWALGRHKTPLFTRNWQCDMAATPELLEWILGSHGASIGVVAIEAWDERGRKTAGFSASAMTRLISELYGIADSRNPGHVRVRPARDVKPWATDRKLEAAGLRPELFPAAMKHSKDGARHALFAACKDLGLRDPMSRVRAASDGEENTRSCSQAGP